MLFYEDIDATNSMLCSCDDDCDGSNLGCQGCDNWDEFLNLISLAMLNVDAFAS